MPAVVKTPADERHWKRARARVEAEYGITDASGGDRYWRLVMGIFERMSKAHVVGVGSCPQCAGPLVLLAPDFETARCDRCERNFDYDTFNRWEAIQLEREAVDALSKAQNRAGTQSGGETSAGDDRRVGAVRGGGDLARSVLPFLKARVRGYTRLTGTYVQPHVDKRPAGVKRIAAGEGWDFWHIGRDVYRAPTGAALDTFGHPMGKRWESSREHWDRYRGYAGTQRLFHWAEDVDDPLAKAAVQNHSVPTVCIDFDGTLTADVPHQEGVPTAPPAAISAELLRRLAARYRVVVLTARPINEVMPWLDRHGYVQFITDVTNTKPPAIAYLDNRGVHVTEASDVQRVLDEVERLARPSIFRRLFKAITRQQVNRLGIAGELARLRSRGYQPMPEKPWSPPAPPPKEKGPRIGEGKQNRPEAKQPKPGPPKRRKKRRLGLTRRPVQHPGERGGKFYYDQVGQVRYGVPPDGVRGFATLRAFYRIHADWTPEQHSAQRIKHVGLFQATQPQSGPTPEQQMHRHLAELHRHVAQRKARGQTPESDPLPLEQHLGAARQIADTAHRAPIRVATIEAQPFGTAEQVKVLTRKGWTNVSKFPPEIGALDAALSMAQRSRDHWAANLGSAQQLTQQLTIAQMHNHQALAGYTHCAVCGKPFEREDKRTKLATPVFCKHEKRFGVWHGCGRAVHHTCDWTQANRDMDTLRRYYAAQQEIRHLEIAAAVEHYEAEEALRTGQHRVIGAIRTPKGVGTLDEPAKFGRDLPDIWPSITTLDQLRKFVKKQRVKVIACEHEKHPAIGNPDLEKKRYARRTKAVLALQEAEDRLIAAKQARAAVSHYPYVFRKEGVQGEVRLQPRSKGWSHWLPGAEKPQWVGTDALDLAEHLKHKRMMRKGMLMSLWERLWGGRKPKPTTLTEITAAGNDDGSLAKAGTKRRCPNCSCTGSGCGEMVKCGGGMHKCGDMAKCGGMHKAGAKTPGVHRPPPLHPGSRGGQGHYTEHGKWEYGCECGGAGEDHAGNGHVHCKTCKKHLGTIHPPEQFRAAAAQRRRHSMREALAKAFNGDRVNGLLGKALVKRPQHPGSRGGKFFYNTAGHVEYGSPDRERPARSSAGAKRYAAIGAPLRHGHAFGSLKEFQEVHRAWTPAQHDAQAHMHERHADNEEMHGGLMELHEIAARAKEADRRGDLRPGWDKDMASALAHAHRHASVTTFADHVRAGKTNREAAALAARGHQCTGRNCTHLQHAGQFAKALTAAEQLVDQPPAHVFLDPIARAHPVKVEREGAWEYDLKLLAVASGAARVQGKTALAARADTIRRNERMLKSLVTGEQLDQLADAFMRGFAPIAEASPARMPAYLLSADAERVIALLPVGKSGADIALSIPYAVTEDGLSFKWAERRQPTAAAAA